MVRNAWLPVGHILPDGAKSRVVLHEGLGWQILGTQGDGRALVVHNELATRWIGSGLMAEGNFATFAFGEDTLRCTTCGPSQFITPVADCRSPKNKSEAMAFATAYKATRRIDRESALQDAIYVESASRLLPTYTISSRTDDAVVLGYWLTGGAPISVKSFRRLRQTLSWLGAQNLREVVEAAGFTVDEVVPFDRIRAKPVALAVAAQPTNSAAGEALTAGQKKFSLPGRPVLEAFFNEHIIDIIQNRARYRALGIDFPSAIVLHGPPGCGKTFAVERLIDFLGWPNFQIDASSVASPYIHETSKKVADVFSKALDSAPSVLVIDEMEAFLAERDMSAGHHRVEEVAEFLRQIPEAVQHEVLIVAMTNRLDMIDQAILRRGRFDHIVQVDFASEREVRALLEKLLSALPKEPDVDAGALAADLAGRPLSDVAFVVREGARLAARSGRDRLDADSLRAALNSTPARDGQEPARRIGFI